MVLRDGARPWPELARSGAGAACLPLWAHELLAHAGPGVAGLLPARLDVVLLHADWPHLVGAVALSTSAVIYALALRALGESWRIGLDRDMHGPLVTRGVFAVMRNPIYVSIDLHVLGTFACSGRLFFLVAAVFTIGTLHVASRVEEAFLTDTYSGAYREYWGRVRRYCPWG